MEFAEFQEVSMHDFLVGLMFVAMVMAPCVIALTTPLGDAGSKYDR